MAFTKSGIDEPTGTDQTASMVARLRHTAAEVDGCSADEVEEFTGQALGSRC
jgi:hypothetical protein